MIGIVGCYKQKLSTVCDRIKQLAFESSDTIWSIDLTEVTILLHMVRSMPLRFIDAEVWFECE